MRALVTTVLAAVMAFGVLLGTGDVASANPIAGGGYSSSYSGESVFVGKAAGQSGQFSAIFFNDGTREWAAGVVGLLVCLADKVTCNVASPNASYASGWYSSAVYATVSSTVAPGQNGFFVYNFSVPAGTPAGTVATFNGDVGLIATGAELHPEGYYQTNTTPAVVGTLSISPTSATLPLNGQQQFTATTSLTGTVGWTVTGGCGAISATGLFVATATNSASQPCTAVASLGSLTASATISVFGTPTSIVCAATPSVVMANGGTSTLSFTLKDVNGNTVANASSPAITVTNSTPTLATLGATGPISPSAGAATTTLTTTTASGTVLIAASATGLTGCTLAVTVNPPGNPASTTASFVTNPIAADGVSTSVLRINVVDSSGSQTTDGTTVIDVSRSTGAGVCSITGVNAPYTGSASGSAGTATDASGRVEFIVTSTTTAGQCTILAIPRTSAIAQSSATLTTQLVGAPSLLAVASNDSPHPAGASSLTTIAVNVADSFKNRVTSATNPITASLDPGTCTAAATGAAADVAQSSGTATVNGVTVTLRQTTSGQAIFQFTSTGAYTGCLVTFSSSGISGTSATIVLTPGAADHFACSFSPSVMAVSSTAIAVVKVVDLAGNPVNSGSYSVNLARTGGTAGSSLGGPTPQTMANGMASFLVQSTAAQGVDTYAPSGSGSTGLAGTNTSCSIVVR